MTKSNIPKAYELRIMGAVLILLGFLLAYMCGYQPLEAAKNHGTNVSLYLAGTFGMIFFPVLGLLGLLGGSFLVRLFVKLEANEARTRTRVERMAIAGFVILSVVAVAVHYWLRSQISEYGYKF